MIEVFGHDLFNNWMEIHQFIMGLSTGIVALWLSQNWTEEAAAAYVIMWSVVASVHWGLVGWEAHTWYFTAPLAAVLLPAVAYRAIRDATR